MDPFFARNRLSAYLDGALSEQEAAEVADAIAADASLRHEYEAMQNAVQTLRREGPTRAPHGFHARVMAAVETEPGPSGAVVRLQRAWNRVPLEAVALAAAAAVVVLVIQGRPKPNEPEAEEATAMVVKKEEAPSPPPLREQAEPVEAEPAGASAGTERTAAAPAETSSKKVRPPLPETGEETAAGAPEPYVASWEQGGAGSADGGLATTYGYRLRIASPEVLFNLSSIAETARGEVRDSAGRVLQPRLLSPEDDFEQTLVAVPLAEANAVRGHLEALGSTSVPPPAAPSLFSADYAVFIVEVRLEK